MALDHYKIIINMFPILECKKRDIGSEMLR